MPKREEMRLNSKLNLLSYILEKGVEKKYWKKIQGFGLKPEDFEKWKNEGQKASSKMFRYWKDELLDSKFIVELKTKGKGSEFYGITPLGIIFILQNRTVEDKYVVQRTFRVLKFYLEKFLKTYYKTEDWSKELLVTSKLFFQIKDHFDVETLGTILKNVCDGVSIKQKRNTVDFSLAYKMDNLSLIFYEYTIENRENYVIFDGHRVPKRRREDDWMFRDIAEFVLSAVVYSLFTKNFSIKRTYVTIDEKKLAELQKNMNSDVLEEILGFNGWLQLLLNKKISILKSINKKIQEITVD